MVFVKSVEECHRRGGKVKVIKTKRNPRVLVCYFPNKKKKKK